MEKPMEAEEYINERVNGQLSYYESAANRNKKIHLRMQTAIILFALLVACARKPPGRPSWR